MYAPPLHSTGPYFGMSFTTQRPYRKVVAIYSWTWRMEEYRSNIKPEIFLMFLTWLNMKCANAGSVLSFCYTDMILCFKCHILVNLLSFHWAPTKLGEGNVFKGVGFLSTRTLPWQGCVCMSGANSLLEWVCLVPGSFQTAG